MKMKPKYLLTKSIETLKESLNENKKNIQNLNSVSYSLNSKLNAKLNACRICVRETEGSSQY